MNIEVSLFSLIISIALLLVCISPIVLVGLLVHDWRQKDLW